MWSLEHPEALLLILALPPLYWLRHHNRTRGGLVHLAFGAWRGRAFQNRPSLWFITDILGRVFFWAGLVSLIIALAGPIVISKEKVFLSQGNDILFVVDISPSMGARDEPEASRLDLAKAEIKAFLDQRSNDAIGLVAFASDAALYCPPTLDYGTLSAAVDNLKVMELGEGTATGLGLALAAVHLRQTGGKNKTIILISDGDNNAGEISPEMAAQMLARHHMRVYALGLGSDQEVYIEYENPQEQKIYRGAYQSTINETLLKNLADATGGRYFRTASAKGLSEILGTVNNLETSETRVRQEIRKDGIHGLFMALGLLGLFLEFFIAALVVRSVR